MITKKNVGLVVDTNILIDIAKNSSEKDLKSVLLGWIGGVLERTKDAPQGKMVRLWISRPVIHDYKTGLSKKRLKGTANQIDFLIDKMLTHKIPLPGLDNIHLSIKKTDAGGGDGRRRMRDRGDEKFLDLTETVLRGSPGSDWGLIVATRDRASMDDFKNHLKGHKTVYFADSMVSLENIIEC